MNVCVLGRLYDLGPIESIVLRGRGRMVYRMFEYANEGHVLIMLEMFMYDSGEWFVFQIR
jgi:hypothetical protein